VPRGSLVIVLEMALRAGAPLPVKTVAVYAAREHLNDSRCWRARSVAAPPDALKRRLIAHLLDKRAEESSGIDALGRARVFESKSVNDRRRRHGRDDCRRDRCRARNADLLSTRTITGPRRPAHAPVTPASRRPIGDRRESLVSRRAGVRHRAIYLHSTRGTPWPLRRRLRRSEARSSRENREYASLVPCDARYDGRPRSPARVAAGIPTLDAARSPVAWRTPRTLTKTRSLARTPRTKLSQFHTTTNAPPPPAPLRHAMDDEPALTRPTGRQIRRKRDEREQRRADLNLPANRRSIKRSTRASLPSRERARSYCMVVTTSRPGRSSAVSNRAQSSRDIAGGKGARRQLTTRPACSR